MGDDELNTAKSHEGEDTKIRDNKQIQKNNRTKGLRKWIPQIFKWYWKLYKLQLKIGLIFAAIMGVYYLGWVFVGAIILMAVGAGMRQAGEISKAQNEFYNEQRIHRSKLPPKYWGK